MAASRPLRVAVLRPYATLPSEGGANDRYVNLCEKLVALGAAPQLYCTDFVHNSKQRRSPDAIALNRQRLPYLRQIRSLPYRHNVSLARIVHEALFGLKALVEIAGGPRPDVVVVGEPLFLVGWLSLLYRLCFRRPVIADLIDLWPEADTASHSGLSGALRQLIYAVLIASRGLRLRCYKAVSFVSHAYARRLSPRGSSSVFYWGSQLMPRGPRTTHSGPLVAIYAGSLGVGYDVDAMLEAAAILRAEGAPIKIVIAGDGPKRDEVLRAQRDGTVAYLGQLSRDKLVEAYEKADIGLLPYQAGSKVAMPIKFFDYVNFGLYAVSSLDMEAQDMIAERAIGVSYAPSDARDLASKLRQAVNDQAALERARTACAALASELAVDAQYERFARFVLGHVRPLRGA